MNALAVDMDGVPLGLIDQVYWTREDYRTGTVAERTAVNKTRPFEDKQGSYFVRSAENARERLKAVGVVPWFVIDREGDNRGILEALEALPCVFTIRGKWNRRLTTASDETNVRESLLLEPSLGVHRVDVARHGKRPARVTDLEVRAKEVVRGNRSSLWRKTPSGWRLSFHQGTAVLRGGTVSD